MAATSRLNTALVEGLIDPSPPVCIVRPALTSDLSALPQEGLTVATGFGPDHAQWQARGLAVSRDPVPARTIIVTVPRSKAYARHLIAEAARDATLVIVDGQKTDGIDSLWKACRARLGNVPSLTKDHGRLFWFSGGDLSDWLVGNTHAGSFVTRPGVFSDDRIDAGSQLLADKLPPLTGRVADLGAGWGFLSQAILQSPDVTHLDLVEAEVRALDCARSNVTDPRAVFHWADATTFAPATAPDTVVMNPPFHIGRAGDPALGRAFIAAAARMLTPRGDLWMVANRHLPYEQALTTAFKQVDELPGTGGFKIFHAARPIR